MSSNLTNVDGLVSSSHVPIKHVTIVPDGDLTLEVHEVDQSVRVVAGQQLPQKDITRFLVSRHLLSQIPARFGDRHNVLQTMLGSNLGGAMHNRTTIKLGEDSAVALEIVLRVFSGSPLTSLLTAPVREMWNLAILMDKYNVDHKDPRMSAREQHKHAAGSFFSLWYQSYLNVPGVQNDTLEENAHMLLWAAYWFDHAQGFLEVTKHLAYTVEGNIEAHNPTGYRDIQMPPRIMTMLNAARGRLFTVLHLGLFKPIKLLFEDQDCPNKEVLAFGYQQELYWRELWPRDEHKGSMEEILRRLKLASYIPDVHCRSDCHRDYDHDLSALHRQLETYFDGLCLDDIEKGPTASKHLPEDCPHRDEWGNIDRQEHRQLCAISRWDQGCRVKHGQPSWYHSHMARKHRKKRLHQTS